MPELAAPMPTQLDERRTPAVDEQLAAALRQALALADADGRGQASLEDLLRTVNAGRSAQPVDRPARITPYRNGPYLVRGSFVLTDQDGNDYTPAGRTVALCRCGRSQLRPFCDGTHKLIGFQAGSEAQTAVDHEG